MRVAVEADTGICTVMTTRRALTQSERIELALKILGRGAVLESDNAGQLVIYTGISKVKTYIVYVDGIEVGTIRAASHNAAEAKAQKKYPGKQVSVEYTEV